LFLEIGKLVVVPACHGFFAFLFFSLQSGVFLLISHEKKKMADPSLEPFGREEIRVG